MASENTEDRARLLLQREREVYELRHTRARAEHWLRAVHALAPGQLQEKTEGQMAHVADLLVGELSYEIAATFELDGRGHFIEAAVDPVELPENLELSPDLYLFLASEPAGSCERATDTPMSAFARQLDMVKYRWACLPSARSSHFLYMAGFSERTTRFHRLTKTDQDHFAIFCSHAAALLNNGLLLSSLKAERQDLELANRELDGSLEELRATQVKLVQSAQQVARASRQAGMAEIATGILHNVGNVLNSINVCTEVAQRQVDILPVEGLRQSVTLLEGQASLAEFFATDERAEKLCEYLRRCSDSLAEGQKRLVGELGELKGHLTHVGAIVSRQQEYARPNTVEPCNLGQLLDDALMLARHSEKANYIEIRRDYEDLPTTNMDKHRVLQILVNLITNAMSALAQSQRQDRQLTAKLRRKGEGFAELQVLDNGIGIATEHAPLLFRHGFTTRPDGHGFGLHMSALTAKELGGELSFRSEGRGLGATFTLRLPLVPARPRRPSQNAAPPSERASIQELA